MESNLYPSHPLLIVDDEPRALQSIAVLLRVGGVNNVIRCQDSREVLEIADSTVLEAVLLDLRMPHLSGEELLPQILQNHPELPVIVITGINDLDTAVRCMRLGAFDYMVKPVEEQRLRSGVQRAIEVRDLRFEYSSLKEHMLMEGPQHPDAFSAFLTNSPRMHSVFSYVETISKSPRPVLVSGETGVGKELIARALHVLGAPARPFVAVNVAGVDDTVFSDTLFGHVPGAFTGADTPRPGLLEQAAGGTIFLDEIGDLKPESQVKLLRLVQEREYYPLGSDAPRRAHARIIVATHHDLESLVEKRLFRRDLFYRLQIHRVHIPPLRERPEDLPLLLDHFLDQASRALQKEKPTPPRELIALLETYAFPGNVRELEAMVFDAVTHHTSKKLSMERFKAHLQKNRDSHLPLQRPGDQTGALLSLPQGHFPTLSQAADFLVAEALQRSKGNQSIAAELLGITPSALNKRLKRARDKDK